MAKILSKYSKTSNLQDPFASQKQFMDSIQKGTSTPADEPEDYRTPFTFAEWNQRNIGLIPGEEYKQYNNYLTEWYDNRYTSEDSVSTLKEDYINLLQQIQLAFDNEEDFEWFRDIDYNDDLQLENAIPFFVKKLKEVAIYFVNKRDAIRKAKLKYNMVGAKNSIENLFYEYLLKAFTQRDYVLNVPEQSAYNTFPALSAVKDGFSIFVEELYDNTSYFDKDPDVDITQYYNLSSPEILSYFETKSFDSDDLEWLFSTGVSQLCADNPLLWVVSDMVNSLPLSSFETPARTKLNDYNRIELTEKYLGQQQYILSGNYYDLKSDIFTYNFKEGNNWFQWPSGEYFRDATDVVYDPILLTETNLISSGATGSTDYRLADKIFVQSCDFYNISGAWLKSEAQTSLIANMSAHIPRNECNGFKFKFPHPGFGILAEGIPWTGPQLDNINSTFNYLPEEDQDNIENMYWSLTGTLSSFNPISIHDTSLVDGGAIPSKFYKTADKLNVRIAQNEDHVHDGNPDEIFKGAFDRAWLYRMDKTDLPIAVNKNYINWPIERYDETESTSITVLSSQCAPLVLADVDNRSGLIGARAGHSVFDSDLIYKLNGSDGYPIECAFLSGAEISKLAGPNSSLLYAATGTIPPGLALRIRPGNYDRFIWYDQDTYVDQTTLTHKDHAPDCIYAQRRHKSIYNTRGKSLEDLDQVLNGIGDWNECTCRIIKYNPVGHPGDEYRDFDFMADILFVDHQFPNEFDLTTWRDESGNDYTSSPDFAFWSVDGTSELEPDVGWGEGEWKTGDGSRMQFKQGTVYQYLRANLRRNPPDLIVNAVPDLIIKQPHVSTEQTRWMKAVLDENGLWTKTVSATDMIINPGDYIMYDHVDSNWFCLTSAGDRGVGVDYRISAVDPVDSIWSDITYATIDNTTNTIWPDAIYNDGPIHVRSELTAVEWNVIKPLSASQLSAQYQSVKITPDANYSIRLEEPGEYLISAVGYGSFGSESITNIPNITAVHTIPVAVLSGSYEIITTYNDTVNFAANIPLSGWSYTTNTYDITSRAARPFWAKGYDDDSIQTKYKGTMKLGGGIRTIIDDYTYITQPDVATVLLSSNSFVTYDHKGSGFNWIQPVDFIVDSQEKSWKKLIVTNPEGSPFSTYLNNITSDMVLSATNQPSDISLSQTNNLLVNYWAVSPFTWTQELTDSSLGIPPTGGLWVAPVTGDLVVPMVPYANLSNRHYPTIATMPYISEVYARNESGGYFIPKMLGASVYYSKDIDTDFEVLTKNSDNRIFQNSKIFGKDLGLTKTRQDTPIKVDLEDSRWMKAPISEGNRSGLPVNAKDHQEFVPYQTKNETLGEDSVGLNRRRDQYDPWNGEYDNVWSKNANLTTDFRGQRKIAEWYDTLLSTDKKIYTWKTDIFGNNYALLKDKNIDSVYDLQLTIGDMYVRNTLGVINSGVALLSAVYDKFLEPLELNMELENNQIYDFDIWFDTIMFETTGNIGIQKILFDYDDGRIYSIADNSRDIQLSALSGGHFAGSWLFEEDKTVILCNTRFVNSIVYPYLWKYDIDRGELLQIYNGESDNRLVQLSSVGYTTVEKPLFTYNYLTKTYNIAFIGYGSDPSDMYMSTINLNSISNVISSSSIVTIVPLSA